MFGFSRSGKDQGSHPDLPDGMGFRPGLEMTPKEACARHGCADDPFVLIDIRESDELEIAAIDGAIHIPLGELANRWRELDVEEDTTIGLLCRSGVRSIRAALLLHGFGLEGARSVAGGILLWGEQLDPSLRRY